MTGKTHVAVGVASALVFTKPQNLKELTLCLGVASIGSLISDIDVKTTKSHKTVDRMIPFAILAGILCVYVEYRWNIGIRATFQRDSNVVRLLSGFAAFLAICWFGKEQPHRSFMHSILALGMLTGSVYVMFPAVAAYFGVAMCSHMVIDTLNYTNVRLLYPLKGGLSFNVCHAKGYINTYVGYTGIIIILLECVSFARMYLA